MDRHGRHILEGDRIVMWLPSPWDEEDLIRHTFVVEWDRGGWFCRGERTNEEDDYLKNFDKPEILPSGKL